MKQCATLVYSVLHLNTTYKELSKDLVNIVCCYASIAQYTTGFHLLSVVALQLQAQAFHLVGGD